MRNSYEVKDKKVKRNARKERKFVDSMIQEAELPTHSGEKRVVYKISSQLCGTVRSFMHRSETNSAKF